MHLHGWFTRALWDGWTADLIQPGEYKDYYYRNSAEARKLQYHDHAEGAKALNSYGQVGMYVIADSALEGRLGLPWGKYEYPVVARLAFLIN